MCVYVFVCLCVCVSVCMCFFPPFFSHPVTRQQPAPSDYGVLLMGAVSALHISVITFVPSFCVSLREAERGREREREGERERERERVEKNREKKCILVSVLQEMSSLFIYLIHPFSLPLFSPRV